MSAIQEHKEALRVMGTPDFAKEINALIKSRTPLIYLVTSEENRVLEYFRHYNIAAGYKSYIWDAYSGLLNINTMEAAGLITGQNDDENGILDWIIKEATDEIKGELNQKKGGGSSKGKIYILLDFHRFLKPCSPATERRLRTLARMDSNTVVIIVGPHYITTPALDREMRVVDFPVPNKEELRSAMYSIVDAVSSQFVNLKESVKDREEEIINAINGLSYTEACSALSKSVCMCKDMHIPTILKEKQQVIKKTGILEFFQPTIGMDDVGGLGNLVSFLKSRKACFSEEAREYGLPSPKGVLLIGVPGGGKSLAAKAAAHLYEMPLLRLDFGSLFAQHVGESEQTTRTAIKVAESLSPCILWIDEVEKGLSGSKSSGATDSGVTSRVISTLLTWMQEKTAPVFLMCTANQHENIPAEFMRAGRFDEIFFVDIPTRMERADIARKIITRKKRDATQFEISEIANRSDGYTGAEIEKAVDMALLVGFQDNRRAITTEDIVDALGRFKPLSVMRPEAIEAMRIWANDRCIKANTPETIPGGIINNKRHLEVDEA